MDNQLITGYDEAGFMSARPWGECVHTPDRLTYGSWDEFGEEIHASFYRFAQVEPAEDRTAVLESLQYAVDLYEKPKRHTNGMYGIGPDAYVNWIGAVQEGHGQEHGAWWNARVWSECRNMAALYFAEIGERFPETAGPARDLAERYATLGVNIAKTADKEMPADEKIAILKATAAAERAAVGKIPAIIEAL